MRREGFGSSVAAARRCSVQVPKWASRGECWMVVGLVAAALRRIGDLSKDISSILHSFKSEIERQAGIMDAWLNENYL
jgi:hypothetical protein